MTMVWFKVIPSQSDRGMLRVGSMPRIDIGPTLSYTVGQGRPIIIPVLHSRTGIIIDIRQAVNKSMGRQGLTYIQKALNIYVLTSL